ncbi:MAG: insulinase family protein [Bacilli bacterium]|nr:insulinase family protein [Bacilli bacterium]
MALLKTESFVQNDIRFHLLPTDRYKTITVVAKLKSPLSRETATMRALIPFVLKQGTASFPSEQKLRKRLDELYGAKFEIDCNKKGTNHILHVQLEFANEKFIPNESEITNEGLKLLWEIIFRPHIKNDQFIDEIVAREKRQLENKINSLYDNKIAYANERLVEEMYKGEPYAVKADGYIEDLRDIDGKSLYDYYKRALTEDDIDIYVLGDFSPNEMKEKLTALFSRKQAKREAEVAKMARKKRNEANKIVERDNISQAKLHIGYRTNCTYKDDGYFALQVFNGLYGGFPISRLFMNVREKHSLAYYVASRIESHVGLLVVYSGVETAKYERAYQIIEEQFTDLKNGHFTEDELTHVKKLITSSIKETLDHPTGTIELLYQQIVGERELPPETLIENINRVKKEDVIAIAEQIELDTIYVLASEEGE